MPTAERTEQDHTRPEEIREWSIAKDLQRHTDEAAIRCEEEERTAHERGDSENSLDDQQAGAYHAHHCELKMPRKTARSPLHCDRNHVITVCGSAMLQELGWRMPSGRYPLSVVVTSTARVLPSFRSSLIMADWSVMLL